MEQGRDGVWLPLSPKDKRRTHNMKNEDLLAIIIMQLGMIMMFVSLFALI